LCKIAYIQTIFILRVLFLLFITHSLLHSEKQVDKFDDYVIRNWTTESGLPHNTVTALVQTSDGYIWIGTVSGLVRFDGVRFALFNTTNTPILENEHILSLYEDPTRKLWIGTNGGGLYRIDKMANPQINKISGLSNDYITVITGDWKGNLWIGTQFGLNRINDNQIDVISTEDGLYDNIITALRVDPLGQLWIGTLRGGVAKFNDEIIRVYDATAGLFEINITSILSDIQGNMLFGTLNGLYRLNVTQDKVRHISSTAFLPVTSILQDSLKNLWLTSISQGFSLLHKDSLFNFTKENIGDDYLHCQIRDRKGNIWLGSDTQGLFQLKNRHVQSITLADGLPGNVMGPLIQDRDGVIWAGSRNNGLSKIENGQITQVYHKGNGLSSDRITTLFEGSDGALWIGAANAGIQILYQNTFKKLASLRGLNSTYISTILEDTNKTIWIGTDKGLYRYAKGQIAIMDHPQLSGLHIRYLLADQNGGLLIAAKTGVFELKQDSLIKLNKTNFDALTLFQDKNSVLWVGSAGQGLKRYFNGEISSCNKEHGLPDNHIFSITELSSQNFWFSSYKGVFKIKHEDLEDFFQGKTTLIHPTIYDDTDGMPTSQCIGQIYPTHLETTAGDLLYPTVKGIAIFYPERDIESTIPPVVFVERMSINNQPVNKEDKLVFPSSTNKVEFKLTALDHNGAHKLSFKYKLDDYESDFNVLFPGANRTINYQNLAPGNYHFQAYAISITGIQSTEPAEVSFQIEVPFYRNFYFQSAGIFIVLFIFGGFYLVRQKKRRLKQLNKYKTSTLDPILAKETIPKLKALLEGEKLFLNPDLTLKDLSKRLNIHYNHLSRIINEQFGQSYNDLINQYRISETQKRLVALADKDKTVLEIMYECGFYSKSVFNTAFKKFTGTTPSQFRKENS